MSAGHCWGGVITIDTLSATDLSLKRALRFKGTVVFEEAVARVKAMFHQLVDVGVGELCQDTVCQQYFEGQQMLQKYRCGVMANSAQELMIRHRVPTDPFGTGWHKVDTRKEWRLV